MRNIVTTLIFIILSIPAFSQNHFIGLKGGMNWTNVHSKNFLSNNDYRAGFNGGFSYEFHPNKTLSLGIDLLYVQKGFTNDIIITEEPGNEGSATIEFNYDYISLPLKSGFIFGNKLSGFANFGLVPSILINAKTIDPAIEGIKEEITYTVTDKATRIDLSGLIEIGGNYNLYESFYLFTSFAYQQSFISLTNDNYFSNGKARHYGIVLSIGFKYAFKKE